MLHTILIVIGSCQWYFRSSLLIKYTIFLHLIRLKTVSQQLDKAPNNIVFVCNSHYVDCLIKKYGTHNSLGNPTYTLTTLTKGKILDNHRFVLWSFGISTEYEEFLNYTSVLTNSVILLGLSIAPRILFPNH